MMAAIQERLRAEVAPLRVVAGAASYAALQAPPPRERLPAAYVMALEDQAEAPGMASGVVRQRLSRRISVVILVSSARDARGEEAAEELEALLAQLRAALVGWAPPIPDQPAGGPRLRQAEPLALEGGRLLDVSNAVLAWEETFACAAILSSL